MKPRFLIAAALFAATIALGFVPTETPIQADTITAGVVKESLTAQSPEIPDSTAWLANSEPALTEFDTSVPTESPEPAEPEKPDSKSAASSSCPAGSSCPSASARSGSGGRWRLFDGDGYLFDRRAAACGGGGRFPVLRRLLGVDRRQSRRAAGRGVFGCCR